ncbi:MAG: TylF/MycF/NovP-related O-methyltransferase [Candidatus Thiodiazotropha sp.]|jgi:O-methyltransferase
MFNRLKLIFRLLFGKASLLERFSFLRRISILILPEYRFKWPQMEWWNDLEFSKYVEQFDGKNSNNHDRRWMAFQLMRLVESIEGDTVECGAYKGATSKLILIMNVKSIYQKIHHIFDSFEGLSKPGDKDGVPWSKNDLSAGEDVVAENLHPYKNFIMYKGWIPDRFDEVKSKKFSFIHVDVDLYGPTKDSIEFFYERMSEGAIFLCNDYGFTSCPGATQAVDEFLDDKPERMIALSGGGGFFVKGVVVSKEKSYQTHKVITDSKLMERVGCQGVTA